MTKSHPNPSNGQDELNNKFDEILQDMLWDAIIDRHSERPSIVNDEDIKKQATQQLKKLFDDYGVECREQAIKGVMGEMPEEKPQTKYMGKRHSLIQGYNNALKDCTQILKAQLRKKG